MLCETDGIRGEERALRERVDVVVLDLMLPSRGGMEVLASLRSAKPEVPVIVLTAKGEVEDRVAGLDAGAVDYLVKPFSLSELSARIRAQLRTVALGATTRLRGEDVELDLLTRKVTRAGEPVALSSTEFELLVAPVAQPRTCRHPRGDPERGVGLPARPGDEHRRRVHRLPAPQAAPSRQPGADRHGPLGRLPLRSCAALVTCGRSSSAGVSRHRSRPCCSCSQRSRSSPSIAAPAASFASRSTPRSAATRTSWVIRWPPRAPAHRERCARGRRLHPGAAVQRELDAAVRGAAGRRAPSRTVLSCSARRLPTTASRRPRRPPRTALPAGCETRAPATRRCRCRTSASCGCCGTPFTCARTARMPAREPSRSASASRWRPCRERRTWSHGPSSSPG